MKTWERDRERHIICIERVQFWKQASRQRESNPHLRVPTGPTGAEEAIDLPGRSPEKLQTRNENKSNN